MFTQGLDSNALKWVGEVSVTVESYVNLMLVSSREYEFLNGFYLFFRKLNQEKKKDISVLVSTQGLEYDHISGRRNSGRGFGLPSSDKFRSGHMSSRIIPMSHAIPRSVDDNASGSDMEIGTDSEDGIQMGEGFFDSSPQDDRLPISSAPKYPSPLEKYRSYDNDKYNSDSSSPRGALQQNQGHDVRRMGDGGSGFSEDGTSNSASAPEISSLRFRNHRGVMPHTATDASEPNVPFQTEQVSLPNVEFLAIKYYPLYDNFVLTLCHGLRVELTENLFHPNYLD